MLKDTGWTMSVMIDTVPRLHPLVDLDFHDSAAAAQRQLFTTERVRAAALKAMQELFEPDGWPMTDPVILRSNKSKGLHVIATGVVITARPAHMNAAFVRTMHKHFDRTLYTVTAPTQPW